MFGGKGRTCYQDFRLIGETARHAVKLCEDKGASTGMVRKMVEQKIRKLLRLDNPAAEQAKMPLGQHITAYKEYKQSRGDSPKDIRQVVRRIERVAKGTRAKTSPDLSPTKIDKFLARWRRGPLSGFPTA